MRTRKYRRSKYRFHTYVLRNGTKGAPVFGEKKAKEDIEKQLGRPLLESAKRCHTKSEWCWREPR